MTHLSMCRLSLTLACIILADCGNDPPNVLTVTPQTANVDAGTTVQLAAELRSPEGVLIPGATFTWTSSAPAIATVSTAGLVSAITGGSATVNASSGGLNTDATINVASVPASVTITPDTVRILQGSTQQLAVVVRNEIGVVMTGVPLTYTQTGGVATVSPTGLVSATSAGQGTVTVTAGAVHGDAPLAITGHPAGAPGAPLTLANGPFGVAVGFDSVLLVTQLAGGSVGKGRTSPAAFTSSITVGVNPTDIIFGSVPATAAVTNQASFNLGLLELAGGTQPSTVSLPGNTFRVCRAGGTLVYVSTSADSVFEVNTATQVITGRVAVGDMPNGLALSADGTRLWVTNSTSSNLSEVNTTTMVVTRTIAVGARPQEVVVSPDGTELYVADELGLLRVVTLATANVADGGAGTENLFGMALTPDGQQLFATRPSTGEVVVIGRASRQVVTTITTGGTPRRVAMDLLGTVAVVANEAGWVDLIR